MSDIVRSIDATGADAGISRRSILQFAGLIGVTTAVGSALSACAGPQGSTTGAGGTAGAGGGSLTVVLNRNLVSLDNKLNQYDAAVTVQRAVRQALTRIGNDL